MVKKTIKIIIIIINIVVQTITIIIIIIINVVVQTITIIIMLMLKSDKSSLVGAQNIKTKNNN